MLKLNMVLVSSVMLCGVGGCLVDFSIGNADRSDAVAACGNGLIETGEECDGSNLAGRTCQDLGFESGTITCGLDCKLDRQDCIGGCGNARLESPEECDDGLANSAMTPDACRPDCRLPFCGDGVADTNELCDSTDLRNQDCASQGLGVGVLTCTTDCLTFDDSDCHVLAGCGDGVIDAPVERCDGTELGTQTCTALGFTGGDLACQADCADYDTSGCLSPFGGQCTQDTQCPGGVCRVEAGYGWPGGFCTQDCAIQTCTQGHCATLYGTVDRCVPTCSDSSECRPGYACFDPWYSGQTFCFPRCEEDGDCPETQQCSLHSGLCHGVATGGDTGAMCAAPLDCQSNVCWLNTSDGYCTTLCNLQTGVCPGDSLCADTMNGTMADMGLCLDTCEDNSDCVRTDHSCKNNFYGPPGDVCLP
jgi:hypothetical protein